MQLHTTDRIPILQIRGVFVMGGVYADAAPLTMPSLPGVLNRFSRCNLFNIAHFSPLTLTFPLSATMNQLYHPARTAAFFNMLAKNSNIPVFTVTNNVVHDLTTYADEERKTKTLEGVTKFLASNGWRYSFILFAINVFGFDATVAFFCRINGNFLLKLAKRHYESRYNPPRKAFDFYTAAALTRYMVSKNLPGASNRRLFFSEEYGLTLVSESDRWVTALESYVQRIDTTVTDGDSEFIKTKKEYFQREISIMRTIQYLPHLEVSICKLISGKCL